MDGSNTPLQVSKSWSSYIVILEFDFIEIEGTIEVIGKYTPKKYIYILLLKGQKLREEMEIILKMSGE